MDWSYDLPSLVPRFSQYPRLLASENNRLHLVKAKNINWAIILWNCYADLSVCRHGVEGASIYRSLSQCKPTQYGLLVQVTIIINNVNNLTTWMQDRLWSCSFKQPQPSKIKHSVQHAEEIRLKTLLLGFCFKTSRRFHFDFRLPVLCVTISRTESVQNNVKCRRWP